MQIVACSSSRWLAFDEARRLARNFRAAEELPEATASVALGVGGALRDWQLGFLFEYRVFPRNIMIFREEWRGREIAAGDIVVQRIIVPPLGWGLCLQVAVRISRIIDEENRIGFAYETLAGHVESGTSEFYFEKRPDGIHFTIHTFSQPAHWLGRMLRPVVAAPYQAWCTRQALNQIRRTFRAVNPPGMPVTHATGRINQP
jgi:hypothetical protein